MNHRVTAAIINLYKTKGNARYMINEPITQIEHAYQTYMNMTKATKNTHLHTAAFLHDIGHLLHENPQEAIDTNMDDCHESIGAYYLMDNGFPEDVYIPILKHVNAKRYLVAVNPSYKEALSEASVKSLELQGGPLTQNEQFIFQFGNHSFNAIALRRCDDEAKKLNVKCDDWETVLQDLLKPYEVHN